MVHRVKRPLIGGFLTFAYAMIALITAPRIFVEPIYSDFILLFIPCAIFFVYALIQFVLSHQRPAHVKKQTAGFVATVVFSFLLLFGWCLIMMFFDNLTPATDVRSYQAVRLRVDSKVMEYFPKKIPSNATVLEFYNELGIMETPGTTYLLLSTDAETIALYQKEFDAEAERFAEENSGVEGGYPESRWFSKYGSDFQTYVLYKDSDPSRLRAAGVSISVEENLIFFYGIG